MKDFKGYYGDMRDPEKLDSNQVDLIFPSCSL